MIYTSKITTSSKLYPDVSYTVKKMSRGRRDELNLLQAKAKSEARDVWAEIESLRPSVETPASVATTSPAPTVTEVTTGAVNPAPPATPEKVDPFVTAKIQDLNDKFQLISDAELNTAWVRWGVDSLSGLTIDGEPATVDTLISAGPEGLFDEVLAFVQATAKLSDEEVKN